MPIFSALEDVEGNTLKAITGRLRRLEYLSGLRDKEGGYHHWGLARIYGELRVKRALADAHRTVLANILATSIRSLEKDLRQSSEQAGVSPQAYLERLAAASSHLLPPAPGAGSGRHLNSVLHALSSLLKNQRRDANPPAL